MAEDNFEIREGFLCPVCKEDLGTILNLHSHFSEEHKEDKDVLSAVKGFFGKAKTIFSEVSIEPNVATKKNDIPETRNYFQEQKLGTTRSLTADFKAARDCKVNYRVTKTNQLLVRLDRLVSDLPFEPSKRKVHEQNVVQWASDEDVKMCPECAKSFGILRRRHHCRLCGSIQCHDCSSFILVSRARKLIYPSQSSPEPVRKISPVGAKNGIRLKLPSSSASVASITSFADVETGEPHLRVCKYCLDLIDHHEWQVDARNNRPAIVVLYDGLISNKEKAFDLVTKYINISRSLWEGETTYLLSDAQNLRLELLKLADTLDSISKRITNLGKDQELPIAGSQLSLQNKVRYGIAQFLKDNLLGLPSLPTEAELEEVRERKRIEALRRLELQKERTAPRGDSQESIRRVYSTSRMSSPEPVSHELGWTANSSKAREDLDGTDHPLVEQMHILRNYIKEARQQHRYDEVATLQENLKELEAEYSKLSTSDTSFF